MAVEKATHRGGFATRLNGLFKRFRRNREGVTAVEFAIVSIPFFGLFLGIIEVALVFFTSELIDSGVSEAARLIRTGQAQIQGLSETNFKELVCANVVILSDCESKIKLDVRTYRDFESTEAMLADPIDENGYLIEDFEYQPGVGGDIVLVRVFYEWPMITPNLGLGPGNLANGDRLLASTVAFRNEPF
ncbi:MAG: pilus assembly protein [Hyphomicrobiales bacterium]|nr:pilus assembly protein [Hyphomicrobiales bacterium]